MPSLTVKNIPNKLYEVLKQSASVNHRSINSEIISCLDRSLRIRKIQPDIFIQEVRQLREKLKVPPLTEEFLKDAKSEGRK